MENQSQALMKTGTTVPAITEETVKQYLFSAGTKLTPQQQAMFMALAVRNQLDPFRREIYAIPYGQNFSIVTGYQTYIQRANGTGLLDGWNVEILNDDRGQIQGARITIHRKDWSHPFVWEVPIAEFDKGTGNWKTMRSFMIRKVAIGQGFRLAFPETLASLPYLAEEMEGAEPNGNHIPAPAPQAQRPAIRPPQPKAQYQDPTWAEGAGTNGNVKSFPEGKAGFISAAQQKRMFAIAREVGWEVEELKSFLLKEFAIEHSNHVPVNVYDKLIDMIQAGGNLPEFDAVDPEPVQ